MKHTDIKDKQDISDSSKIHVHSKVSEVHDLLVKCPSDLPDYALVFNLFQKALEQTNELRT